MPLINELKTQTLTRVVESVTSPNNFLTRLLYGREQTLETETVRIDTRTRGRLAAPFVRKHGEALMVPGRTAGGYDVTAPNIRIKRPFTPSESMFNRQVGQGIFAQNGQLASYVQQTISDDLADMVAMIDESKEWMVSRTLQGTIAYEVADQEVFTITYPRDSNHNVTLSHFWDNIYPDIPSPLTDIYQIKKLIADAGEPNLTDAILGEEATTAFLRLVEQKLIPTLDRNYAVNAGSATLVSQFQANGALYLGTLGGINFWGYTRTTQFVDTTVQIPLIRSKYAEFVSTASSTDRVMYYGAIPDMKALRGGKYRGRMFAKAWEIDDPSSYVGLVHSRPLPVPRRPNASVSVQIVA